MPPRKPLSVEEVAMILSAVCFFTQEGDRLGDKRYPVNDKVAECLGISVSTVKRVKSANKENGGEKLSPPSRKRLCTQQGRPDIKLDDFTLGVIRRNIFDFYLNKIFPTIETLHQKLKQNLPDFPGMSDSTLRRIIKKLGFRFKRFNKKPILMESLTIAASRHTYLRRIKSLREAGYKIFYTDETWCGQNHTMKFGWQENMNVIDGLNSNFNNYDQYRGHIQQIYGWRGGFMTPSGAGKRVIILHIGSEEGFLEGGELCFIGKKGTGDYHNEMNASHFEEWFKTVLGLLPEKSAIVIDQAPYHTMIDPETRNPTMSWKKAEIITWLEQKNIPKPPTVNSYEKLTKAELILHAKPRFGIPQKKLEQIKNIVKPDCELVWLPVAHCELNPIELIWAFVKGKVAKVNMANQAENGRSMEVMRELCQQALRSVTPALWQKCVSHAMKIEDRYWEQDTLENIPQVQPVVINFNSDSDSSDSDGFTDDE